MDTYNIVLSHGPVQYTEYIGNDTVIYTLEDGRKLTIKFSVSQEKAFSREITDSAGNKFYDEADFDVFNEGLTLEDYAQWTADNFIEIEALVKETVCLRRQETQ